MEHWRWLSIQYPHFGFVLCLLHLIDRFVLKVLLVDPVHLRNGVDLVVFRHVAERSRLQIAKAVKRHPHVLCCSVLHQPKMLTVDAKHRAELELLGGIMKLLKQIHEKFHITPGCGQCVCGYSTKHFI